MPLIARVFPTRKSRRSNRRNFVKNCTLTHRFTLLSASIALATFAFGCGQPAPPPDNRAADEAAIMQADAGWSAAASKKDLDAIMSFVADDTLGFPPNEPMEAGKDAARAGWEKILALPDVSLSWKASKAVAARSGDLGYSYGAYELSFANPDGSSVKDNGKYVTIWTKQADGSWKVAADIYNSDLPLPAPPAPASK